jgi:general L-amino acid transport system permease protein
MHRNIPLLVLLFLWYRGVFAQLPPVRESLALPGPIFANQRGVYLPALLWTPTTWIFLAALFLGVAGALAAWIVLRKIREETGRQTWYGWVSLGILVLLPLAGWVISGGAPFRVELPRLQGFNFRDGAHLTPEFTALLIGLFTYTAAFIAEIVRAGIQAVSRGQIEAARALGLRERRVLNLVIMPQALRIIVPPLISQYLNLTKNSSLAVFLGYPELFSIGKTVINQAGRAVPVFVFIMAAYLVISLITALLLNIYNRRVQFLEK